MPDAKKIPPEIVWYDENLHPIPVPDPRIEHIREVAEDGKPFTEWDQYTVCNKGEDTIIYPDGPDKPPKIQENQFVTPSKLPNKYVTVYGEGSLYCIQLTLDELMELHWRINHVYFRFIPVQIPCSAQGSAGQPAPEPGTRAVSSEARVGGDKSFGSYSYYYHYVYDNYDNKESGASISEGYTAVERGYKKDDFISGYDLPEVQYTPNQSGLEKKIYAWDWWDGPKKLVTRYIGMYTGYGANEKEKHGNLNTTYAVDLYIYNTVGDRFSYSEEGLGNSYAYDYGASSNAAVIAHMEARARNFLIGDFDVIKVNNNEYWLKPLSYVDVNYFVGADGFVGFLEACQLASASFEKIDATLRDNDFTRIPVKNQPNLSFNPNSTEHTDKDPEYYQGSWYDSAPISIKLSNRKVEGRYFIQATKYSRNDGSVPAYDYCPDQRASSSASLGAFSVPELSFTIQKWLKYDGRYNEGNGKIIRST